MKQSQDPQDSLRDYYQRYAHADAKGTIIAIPHTWPDLKNAEYEVVQRICLAAVNIGATLLVIDNDGYPLWRTDGVQVDGKRRIGRSDADFMISLHFLSPRLVDLPSYYAHWQPLQFYFDFGYDGSTDKLLTHDDGLSCASDEADAHIRSLMVAADRPPVAPFPYLFHSPPEPYRSPQITAAARLFYIGINWERLGAAGKGRFHELLHLLEDADIVDIYGPSEVRGVAPWEGYSTYRGEIPFDGTSVVEALNRSGICLALSSASHQQGGVMSNRLFEGLAAGCVVISNPHPFIDKYLSDVVYVVDDKVPDDEIFTALQAIVEEVRSNPELAAERARIGQARLGELFSLERCLTAIAEQHPERQAAREAAWTMPSGVEVTVLIPASQNEREALLQTLESLEKQRGISLRIIVVCRDGLNSAAAYEVAEKAGFGGDGVLEVRESENMGSIIEQVTTTRFCLAHPGVTFFVDHMVRLAQSFDAHDDVTVTASGLLAEEVITDEETGLALHRRKLIELTCRLSLSELTKGQTIPVSGQLMFSRAMLEEVDTSRLSLFDGQEHLYLLCVALRKGRMAQVSAATCVTEGWRTERTMSVRISQLLLDTVRFDQRYVDVYRTCQVDSIPAAHLWPVQSTRSIDLGVPVPTQAGSYGATLLGEGFSEPERTFTWVNGDRAEIRGILPALLTGPDVHFLWIEIGGRQVRGQPPYYCTVSLNGLELGQVEVTSRYVNHVFRIYPASKSINGIDVRINLKLDREPSMVIDQTSGKVIDWRKLGICIASFGFSGINLPVFSPAKTRKLAKLKRSVLKYFRKTS